MLPIVIEGNKWIRRRRAPAVAVAADPQLSVAPARAVTEPVVTEAAS
jgi:hypothetical protein